MTRAAASKLQPGEKTALVLSGGGPTAPLIAGALHAFYEAGIRFDSVYTAGGGALVGLLLVAPRVEDPSIFINNEPEATARRLHALERIPEMLSIQDEIYDWFPLNYKAFFKPGPSKALRRWANLMRSGVRPGANLAPELARFKTDFQAKVLARVEEMGGDPYRVRRLYNDWIDLVAAMLTPPVLSPKSHGLCPPFPFIDEMVDFDVLNKHWDGSFYVPAYELTREVYDAKDLAAQPDAKNKRLVQFTNGDQLRDGEVKLAGAAEFRACLAAPFIYPPVRIGDKLYTEGAFHDPQNVDGWVQDVKNGEIKNVIVMDTLGTPEMEQILLRAPRSLWDAFGISIMTSAVAMARIQTRKLKHDLDEHNEEKKKLEGEANRPSELVRVIEWEIPQEYHANIMDWSYSNLSAMFRLGREAGERYLDTPSRRFPGHPRNRDLLGNAFAGRQEYALA